MADFKGSRPARVTYPYHKRHPGPLDGVCPRDRCRKQITKHTQPIPTPQNIQVNALFEFHTPPYPLKDRIGSWLLSYTNTPVSKIPRVSSANDSLVDIHDESPLKLSRPPLWLSVLVSSDSTQAAESRLYSLPSRANFTDEIDSTTNRHKQDLLQPYDDERLKASHPAATCPQSSSSTDATITANNHKEPKRIDSGMSVCIGGPIHASDSDDDVDSDWDERLAPFMLAVTTPNFGKVYGASYQRNSSPSHDHSNNG